MKRIKKYVSVLFFLTAWIRIHASDGIVAENFRFAAGQFAHAFTQIEQANAQEAKKPPLAPRSVNPDGSLRMSSSGDWTCGFFAGELWYMYEYTRDPYWEKQARAFTAPLEREKHNRGTHDLGFMLYCPFGNGYRLTGDPVYRDILLQAASTLAGRYDETVGAIRSWDHHRDKWRYPVIIDNMINLELLFWAARESGDTTFCRIAVNHARTTARNHFRPDYSTYHVVDYEPQTGDVLHRHTQQGYAHESAWARGQAWGLYGFTMCYRETGLDEFLDQAVRIADFIFSHPNLPDDLVPYWDYNAPEIPDEPRDVSSAAIAASALYELSLYDGDNAVRYRRWADTILRNLVRTYRIQAGKAHGFLLGSSTGNRNKPDEVDTPIVYADYYFLEALLRREKLEKQGKIF